MSSASSIDPLVVLHIVLRVRRSRGAASQRRSFVRVHKLMRCELITAGSDRIEESDLLAR